MDWGNDRRHAVISYSVAGNEEGSSGVIGKLMMMAEKAMSLAGFVFRT